MRAWRVHGHGEPADVLRLEEVPEPVAGPGEVRLRVRAAAIGLPDAFMCRGSYAFRPPMPFVPGQEVCGVVDAAGEGVAVEPGARLMAVTSFTDGRGGFAEWTVARAESAFRVPDGMDDLVAAAFRITFSTAWIGLVRRGALAAGETLLVLGAAGGSGAGAVRLGSALGAHVIAVAGGEAKAAACRAMGADAVIDRTTTDVPAAVHEATGGRGVDVVYDPVGGTAAGEALGCLAPGGRLLAVGFASGEWVRPDVHRLVRRNASLVGVYAGGFTRKEAEADHEALLDLAALGRLDLPVTAVPFEKLAAAVGEVGDGTAVGKLVARLT